MSLAKTFDPRQLLADATEAAGGLTDFGDPNYYPALSALTQSLVDDAQLSETGADLLRQKLVGQLANRLRTEDYFARYPEIAEETIAPPVIIVGLPRTGTTKLHRMLACDPRFHWMSFWESQFPVPLPDETLENPQQRIAQAEEMVRMMTEAMPKLAAIHPMETEAADEEAMLMEQSMYAAFSAYAYVPGYEEWLKSQDLTPAYRYLRRMLQFLQWQKRQRGITAERWVLKSPVHLLHLATLLRVFPDAKIVQTHRDPLTSVPSLASFIHTLWCIYSDRADPVTVGRVWSERMQRSLTHTLNVRASTCYPAEQFLDIDFSETVEQPLAAVREVYSFIGRDLHTRAEARLQDWLARDAESHQGGHQYTAVEFGLNEGQLGEDFADYRKRHIGVSA